MKLFIFALSDASTEGQCEVLYVNENVTCKELVLTITSRFDEIVRILIDSSLLEASNQIFSKAH